MKALSITRPWTELILRHGKTVENRTWATLYRGPLLVHAAKSWQGNAVAYAGEIGVEISWDPADYPLGIVGLVDLVGICGTQIDHPKLVCDCGPWAAAGHYHWKLANPRPFGQPIACNGALHLWTPGAETAALITDQIGSSA